MHVQRSLDEIINDLSEAVKSMLQMFADDTKIFRGISNECDAKQLA